MPWSLLFFTNASAMTLIRKLIQGAFVLPLFGLVLTLISYKTPNTDQIKMGILLVHSQDTLSQMKLLFILMPLVMIIIGIIASPFSELTKQAIPQ